jgi:hypothetical protein
LSVQAVCPARVGEISRRTPAAAVAAIVDFDFDLKELNG